MEVEKRTKKGKEWPETAGLSGRVRHDAATINRILLSFRPIAPKPAASDAGSGSDNGKATGLDVLKDMARRPKRKYVRGNKAANGNGNGGRKCKSGASAGKELKDDNGRKDLRFDVDGAGFFGFPGPDPMETSSPEELGLGASVMMRFGSGGMGNSSNDSLGLELGLGLGSVDRETVETWVVVSGVTAVAEVVGIGSTDGEKMRSLDVDTCPGMISDGQQSVQWMNQAYREMVMAGVAEVSTRLVVKENIPAGVSAFACTVRVVYTWRKEKYSKVMPCDVWKMDFGGFAWRFDTKAALCLGR